MAVPVSDSIQAVPEERRIARQDAARWFILAIASLAVAAVFSITLIIGRAPVISAIFANDVDFPRRSLVVHVNLSLGVWFFCMLAGLFSLLPGAKERRTAPLAIIISTIGTILFIIPMFFRNATPVLSDYILILHHPLFLTGLVVFAAGIVLNFVDSRIFPTKSVPSDIPPEAQNGIRIAALAFCIALLTMVGAHYSRIDGAGALTYFQHLFWGGGHILQAVNALGMLVVWLMLIRYLTRNSAVTSMVSTALFILILLPTLAGPFLTFGNHSAIWFTRMMEYGIFPATLVFLAYCISALWKKRRDIPWGSSEFVGWIASVLMTLLGFVLGGMITVSNTLIPAHYHANIGAVTVAYMAVTLMLLKQSGFTLSSPRLSAWQPAIYAIGQTIFVIGYAIAGKFSGAARKAYGPQIRQPAEWMGMAIAGFGGAIALIGGVIFVIIVIKAVRNGRSDSGESTKSTFGAPDLMEQQDRASHRYV